MSKNNRSPVKLRMYLICGFAMAAVLCLDLALPLGVAVPVLYTAVVLVALRAPGKRFIVALACLASLLTVGPLWYKEAVLEPWKAVSNRGLALFSVWVTVYLGLKNKRSQEERASLDRLTGLPNRALFLDRLNQAVHLARRRRAKLAILFLDLDGFKPVNDRYGHAVGDQLLQSVARLLLSCVRRSDTVGRIGGDEFVVLLNGVNEPEEAGLVAAKVLERFTTPLPAGTGAHRLGASIGISIYPEDGDEAHQLLVCADQAMYEAKRTGKNHYRYGAGVW